MCLQPRIPPLMSLNVFPKLHQMYNPSPSKSQNPQPCSSVSPALHAIDPSCSSTSPVTCAVSSFPPPHPEPSAWSGKSPSQSVSSAPLSPDPSPCPVPSFPLPATMCHQSVSSTPLLPYPSLCPAPSFPLPSTVCHPIVGLLCQVVSSLLRSISIFSDWRKLSPFMDPAMS